MRKTQIISIALLAGFCLLAVGNEVQAAGSVDSALNWLLGLLIGGGIAGAGGVAGQVVVKRAKSPDVYRVWFATNRQRQNGEYTSELSNDLQYGTCKIAIPKSHEIGSTGSGSIKRALQRIRYNSDDALYVMERREWSKEHFLKTARIALCDPPKSILVYVHGFNVSFDDAVIRAGQIGFDLKVEGITAAFCWASKADPLEYAADEDVVKLSERHLAEFLALLHGQFPQHKINILAHSMGNRALLGVLANLGKYPSLLGLRFGQIFLAAPDIDVRYFRSVAGVYPSISERTTLYVCSRDRALQESGVIHSDQRTGYTPPVTVVMGVDTIDASDVDLDVLGHSYFAEAYNVIYDLYLLLHFNSNPPTRLHIREAKTEDGFGYWSLAVRA